MKRILLLAGTAEARSLAGQRMQGADLIASLAGATNEPHPYACQTRIGGFGGADGLMDYLVKEDIAAIVDATHPFARQISANASIAAARTQRPLLVLRRPPWSPQGTWQEFQSLVDASANLPAGAIALLTTGRQEIGAFTSRTDVRFVLRSIEDPGPLPDHLSSVRGRPPFSVKDEIALMREEGITHLVTKNAGGSRPAKLAAAAELGIPVYSIAMPPILSGPAASTAEEAMEWIAGVIQGGKAE